MTRNLTPKNIATLTEIKTAQLDITAKFAEFCSKHDLCFTLAYGSLLGAVRHNGYIPWDDDIDLIMPWADYKRFCDLISRESDGYLGSYRVADPLLSPPHKIPYHSFYMKIYDDRLQATKSELKSTKGFRESVFIDVFPQVSLDIPAEKALSDPRIKELYQLTCDVQNLCFSLKRLNPRHPRKAAKAGISILHTLIRNKSLPSVLAAYFQLMEELDTAENNTDALAFLEPGVLWCDHQIFRHNQIGNTILHPFEDLMLPIPEKYDDILTEYYGNWRKLPPVESRIPSHNQEFIWLN